MTPNELCPDSTPLFLFEGKTTDLSKSFLLSFGQPVVAARLGGRKRSQHIPRNELGIIVMPPNQFNGSYMVYLPEHGHSYVASRYNVKAIFLGEGASLNLGNGKRLLTSLGTDGAWHLKNKGDNATTVKDYMSAIRDVELTNERGVDLENWIPSSRLNSSITDASSIQINTTKSDGARWEERTFGLVEPQVSEEGRNEIDHTTQPATNRISLRSSKGIHSERLSLLYMQAS